MPDVGPRLAEVEKSKGRTPAGEVEGLAPEGTRRSPDKGARPRALENTSAPASTSASEVDPSTSSSESWMLNSRSGKAWEAQRWKASHPEAY